MIEARLPPWFKLLTFFFAFGVMVLLFGDGPKIDRVPVAHSLIVTARPVPVPRGNVDIPTALSLKLVEAWEMNSANPELGGISAMHASGPALSFLSDRGALIRLGQSGARRWQGVVGPLPSGCGDMRDRKWRDTESFTTDERSGSIWIGFESHNGLCRIASAAQGGTRRFTPDAMQNWPETGGAEAMTRLKGGAFLIFAERPADSGPTAPLLHFDRDPLDPAARVTAMRYRPPAGYRPVDVAQLPDGRLLVLNRRFELPFAFSAKLSIVTLPKVKAGLTVSGPIIARIEGDGLGENYEALSIDNDGRDLSIWIASDDNFLSIQKTLLLHFVWPGAARLEAEAAPR